MLSGVAFITTLRRGMYAVRSTWYIFGALGLLDNNTLLILSLQLASLALSKVFIR